MADRLLSVCGLNCKLCPAYIALKTNDDELRRKTAAEWTEQYQAAFEPEMINCVGCCEKKGIHGGYCDACPLRRCAFEKNVSNCFVCLEFDSCQSRKDFETHSGMSLTENFKEI